MYLKQCAGNGFRGIAHALEKLPIFVTAVREDQCKYKKKIG